MKKVFFLILGCFLLMIGNANAAILTFDDIITGATSYSFDGDGDTIDDVIFTTTDPSQSCLWVTRRWERWGASFSMVKNEYVSSAKKEK